MSDIVEELEKFWPVGRSDAKLRYRAAEEIKRLREALQIIADGDMPATLVARRALRGE